MPSEHDLHHLIGRIYDAGCGEDDWTTVLLGFGKALDAPVVALQRPAEGSGGAIAVGTDPAHVRHYNSYYHRLLPTGPMLPRLPSGFVYVDRELVPDADYTRTEFYNDFLIPQDQHVSLSWLTQDRGGPSVISLWRPRGRPDWGPQDRLFLHQMGPHLARALEIERRLTASVTNRARRLQQSVAALSLRERDCLARLARGASTTAIAHYLDLPAATIDGHIEAAMRKLGVLTRAEAAAMAILLGLIGP